MPDEDKGPRGAGVTLGHDDPQKLPGQQRNPMLDSLLLAKPSGVVTNVHNPGIWEPVRQHGLIGKPVDSSIEPWLVSSSTKPRNGNYARPAISSYYTDFDAIWENDAPDLLNSLCRIVGEVGCLEQHIQPDVGRESWRML